MHELPVVQSLFDLCIRHANANDASRVISITLRVGEASDLQDEWIQRYFDYVSKGTMAEGAKLIIERVPLVVRCKQCSEDFQVNLREVQRVLCPRCNETKFEYVSGREYRLEHMEIV